MRKIFYLLFILVCLISIKEVKAINYYNTVNVVTTFSEDINIDEINNIYILYFDSTQESKNIDLTKENNFTYTIDKVPVGNVEVEFGIINDDKWGTYHVESTYEEGNGVGNLTVLVSKEEVKTTKKIDANDDGEIIIDDEEETTSITSTTSKIEETTTTTKGIIKSEEEIEQELKKINNQKKTNIIAIVMYSLIGVILVIGLLFASIKIARANK